jgi:pentose-5-phosphate-3-epimerase
MNIGMKIIPAILAVSPDDLRKQVLALCPFFDLFHIDIQDGLYVPSKTVSLYESILTLQEFSESKNKKINPLIFDFHLMLSDYEEASKTIMKSANGLKIRHIYVHNHYKPDQNPFDMCQVVNPDEKIDSVNHKIFDDSSILIMTVQPGNQGQKIRKDCLQKISILRNANFKGTITIDGGVNPESLENIMSMDKDNIPDECCVGSFLSQASEIELTSRIGLMQSHENQDLIDRPVKF